MYTLEIIQDSDPENPRTAYGNLGTMTCFHRRYRLGDKHDIKHEDFNSWDELEQYLIESGKAEVILPLYLYDHSGITISTTPFNDRFDSGQVGFVWISLETIENEAPDGVNALEWAKDQLLAEVLTYDQFLTGDVWGYVIKDSHGDEVDSCWGFYGEDVAKQEGEAAMACMKPEMDPLRDLTEKWRDKAKVAKENGDAISALMLISCSQDLDAVRANL